VGIRGSDIEVSVGCYVIGQYIRGYETKMRVPNLHASEPMVDFSRA
jgi:hypothetical protein